jgi:hypothetical protein
LAALVVKLGDSRTGDTDGLSDLLSEEAERADVP